MREDFHAVDATGNETAAADTSKKKKKIINLLVLKRF